MIALAAAFALAAAAPTVTPARLPPVERCRGDASFDRFRARLSDAITRKDIAALRRLSAPDVMAHYGGGNSWDAFSREWDLPTNGAMSPLWKELAAAMALGCAWTEAGGAVFPGMFEDMGDDVDPFELAVARPGAKLQSSPDDRSPVIAKLDWSSAIIVETEAPRDWLRLQLVRGGPVGWARKESLLSPLGYRLVCELRDGQWLITAFVAGD